MDLVLISLGILFFAAWMIGLIVGIPSISRKLFGQMHQGNLFRKGLPMKRKKAF